MTFPNLHLDVQERRFSLANARALARFSQLAYSQHTISHAGTDTQLLLWELEECVVVAFRGTSSVQDLFTDLKFRRELTKFPGMEIHRGFELSFSSVMDETFMELVKRAHKPVFFTGHSLGGALATIAAHFFFRVYGTLSQVYTFGQPRVGDAGFVSKYNSALRATTWRVANQDDPIPMLPPLTMGYRAAGQFVFLTRKGGININPSFLTTALINAAGAIKGWSGGQIALMPNHAIQRYIDNLDAIGRAV